MSPEIEIANMFGSSGQALLIVCGSNTWWILIEPSILVCHDFRTKNCDYVAGLRVAGFYSSITDPSQTYYQES